MPNSFQTGYGKTVGLPYDEYLPLGTDFAPVWWDSETPDAYSQIFLSQAKGGEWYVDGAKRYKAGDWPKKPMTFFDKTTAIQVFPTSPTPPAQPNPCTGCPSAVLPAHPAPHDGGSTRRCRVVHWGTGNTGTMGLKGILGHPDLELVGCFVARPERAGQDAGELVGRPRVGVTTTNDVDELLAIDADCLSYFGAGRDGIADVTQFLPPAATWSPRHWRR